jgi:hypothetical protein
LLSGVVVSFDKFNPKVGTPDGIPILGEMMTSRWAFEAFMVTQFKDNPVEKQFYKLDQKASIAEYKRVYYIPTLESRLSFVYNNPIRWNDNKESNPVKNSLDLLRSEISNELTRIGAERFPEVESLQIGKFDSTVNTKTEQFLKVLKEYYGIRANNAASEKDKVIQELTNTPERLATFNTRMLDYQNDAVTDMVENSNSATRIVEWKGKLIQKIFPIYFDDHRPDSPLDFSANFYSPTKHFLGKIFDTLYFNIGVIWCFTLLLYIALYFRWLKRLVHSLELKRKYSWRKGDK